MPIREAEQTQLTPKSKRRKVETQTEIPPAIPLSPELGKNIRPLEPRRSPPPSSCRDIRPPEPRRRLHTLSKNIRSPEPRRPLLPQQLSPRAKVYRPPPVDVTASSGTRKVGDHLVRELDELDTLVANATKAFQRSDDWEQFFDQQKDPRGDWAEVARLNHPAARLLHLYKQKGVPVVLKTEPWSLARKSAALARGPHKSAKEHIEFLREEYASMMKKGHWTLLPAQLLMHQPDLRLSPLGVVPQVGRRPRTISDYSYFGVNEDTVPLAPVEAMQFGRALQRLLQRIHDSNPRYGPVYLAKIDIADGFYRVGLRPTDALKLAVLFPQREGEEPLIGVPLTLPMGWRESPPAFCTATETTADLANFALQSTPQLGHVPHRLDLVAETPPPPETVGVAAQNNNSTPVPNTDESPKLLRPLQYWDVYVDDFLGLAQGDFARRKRVKRVLLHTLDQVFRPLEEGDVPTRQEPASVKKLLKGDATWATRKVMLGWLIDTERNTIELPPHRIVRLNAILEDVSPNLKVIDEKKWHKVLGELRSMSIAIPGSRGLFSLLQEALRHREQSRPRIRLTKDVHRVLDDFRWLAKDIASRPTRLAELLPNAPRVLGACDAAGTGMGGVFFVPTRDGYESFLWRAPFPPHIQADLVSFRNPHGSINNSDLELCGNIAHHDALARTADVREKTIWTASDNTANVYWLRKGSTTTTGPPAHLLRIQAHHQRYHRYVPLHDYIPGPANEMADLCSRAWHLTDSQLLSHFNSHYPQTKCWRVCQPNSDTLSALTSALLRKPLSMEFVRKLPNLRIPIGTFGRNFARKRKLTHSSPNQKILSPSSKSLRNATVKDVSPPVVNPSQLVGYQTSSARWARRSCGWGPQTPG